MKAWFKHAAVAAAVTVSMFASAAVAQAAEIPKVIKLVVPFSPGAGTDIVARALAHQLSQELDVDIIVENKPGASGMIGARSVANGPKDGSELMVFSNSLISSAATLKNVPIDVTKDVMPVAMLSHGPMLVGVPIDSPIKEPADLIEMARAKPGVLNHGTAGTGTIAHMAMELLSEKADIKLTHIPYKGTAPAVVDMIGGSLDVMIASYSSLASVIDSGRARVIAVTTLEPASTFPGLPAMSSVAPGFETTIWIGLWAPAGVPQELMERLNKAVIKVTHSDEYAKILKVDGHQPSKIGPAELAERVRQDYATWTAVAKRAGIVVE